MDDISDWLPTKAMSESSDPSGRLYLIATGHTTASAAMADSNNPEWNA